MQIMEKHLQDQGLYTPMRVVLRLEFFFAIWLGLKIFFRLWLIVRIFQKLWSLVKIRPNIQSLKNNLTYG